MARTSGGSLCSRCWCTESVPSYSCSQHGNSGAPAARRAAKRSPILIWEREGNPSMNFLMVIMASGIARGRVRTTTTTTESRKMAAILQIIGWQRHAALVYRLLLSILDIHVTINDTCQNKVSADQYHVTISWAQAYSSSRPRVFWSWPLTKYWLSIGSRAHVMLTCWEPGRIVRKPANGSPGLKFIWIITFSSIQMFFAALFWVYGDYKPQHGKSNSKQKTSPQSYKTQINILPFPGLAQMGTEQLGQGATLLGWPKSIYYLVASRFDTCLFFQSPFNGCLQFFASFGRILSTNGLSLWCIWVYMWLAGCLEALSVTLCRCTDGWGRYGYRHVDPFSFYRRLPC